MSSSWVITSFAGHVHSYDLAENESTHYKQIWINGKMLKQKQQPPPQRNIHKNKNNK